MNRIEALEEIIANRLWEDENGWIEILYKEIRELRQLGYNVQIDNDDFWRCVIQTVDIRQFYHILPMEPTYIRRFKANGRSYTVNFEQFGENTDLLDVVNNLMANVVETALITAEDRDYVGLQIDHPSLETPIIIPFRKKEMMTVDLILSIIERVSQSKKELRFNSKDPMRFKFIIFSPPVGEGRTTRAYFANYAEFYKQKTGKGGSILMIKNDDKYCCARALVTAKAYVDKDKDYKMIAKGDRGFKTSEQKRRALDLMESAGLKDHKGGCGIEELQKFQLVLPAYQIVVLSKEHMNTIVYEGPANGMRLQLYCNENHYDVIKTMKGFMGTVYWCFKCKIGYSNKEDHKCERGECPSCDKSPICQFDKWIHCFDCNRWFRSQQCIINHRETASKTGDKRRKMASLCERIQRCKKCDKLIHMYHVARHYCESYICSICHDMAKNGEKHLCFMQQITEKDYEKKIGKLRPTFIFYDIETRQDEITEDGEYRHIPNLIISHKVCDKCQNVDKCKECGQRERIFKGDKCLNEFCQWLFSAENRYATVIAHNAKGFDGQFLLKYLHTEGVEKPNIITRGMKIMLLEVANIRLIDSLNFLPMRLSEMPKTFGIQELKKGYFPHFFNTKENELYVGPMPSPDTYGIDQMKDEERSTFLKWYASQEGREFNMAEEIVAYCRSDVQILQECCLKFREIFKQTTGVDPLLTSLTIASACNVVFRKNFLENRSIGLIPNDNYCSDERQSAFALKYLLWLEKCRNVKIQHKLNGGEKRIKEYKADGFVEPNTCIEVYGCYYHGCPKCIKNRFGYSTNAIYNADELLQKLLDRKKVMETEGYVVEEYWECQINLEKVNSEEMRKFFKETVVNEPLNPREAFFGGRTNSLKLYHKCEEGERISYVDVCSLYPYICKYGAFPRGHPTIYSTADMEKINKREYFGLIKCTVVPPKGLYHPVLPQRINDKLMFVLCRMCAEAEDNSCNHSDEERSIKGTWTHFELYKAMDKGYEELDLARPKSTLLIMQERAADCADSGPAASTSGSHCPVGTTTAEADNGQQRVGKPKPVVPPKPPMDSFRYSMANIQECADVDLDVLLGELCALESQLLGGGVENPTTQCYNTTTRITINGGSLHKKMMNTNGYCVDNQHKQMDRSHSPDNDSAFCDSLSLMSSESVLCNHGHRSRHSNASSADSTRGSLTTPSPTQLTDSVQMKIKNVQEEMKKENLTDEEQNARLKAEKIKIALEKMKEASVRKLYVKFFSPDGSSKNILIDERWTVSYVLRQLAEKNFVALSPNYALVEQYPDLHMERIYEDHEHIVENILLWSRDSSNKLYFVDRRDKYDVFYNPEIYLCNEQKPSSLDISARRRLLEEFFGFSHSQPPEVEGILYLKTEGKKVWKKHYFVLRSSGLYYVPKGKTKSSKDLVCLMQLDTAQIYNGIGWKKKYKAPTDYGFALKHPQIQVKNSRYIKYLCVEDEKTYAKWITGLRLAKNGKQLYDNFENVKTYLDSDEAKIADSKLQPLLQTNNDRHNVDDKFADYCKHTVVMRPKPANHNFVDSTTVSINPTSKNVLSATLSVDTALKDRPRSADIVRRSGSIHGIKRQNRNLITVETPAVPVAMETAVEKINNNHYSSPSNNRRNTAPCAIGGPLLICADSLQNANNFDIDTPRTSTIKKQPSSLNGRAAANLPLTDSVRHIHSVSMRFYNSLSGASNGTSSSIDSSTCSIDSKGSTEDETDSDEDLPPPPTAAADDAETQSVAAFPPPPSPLPRTMYDDDSDATPMPTSRQPAAKMLPAAFISASMLPAALTSASMLPTAFTSASMLPAAFTSAPMLPAAFTSATMLPAASIATTKSQPIFMHASYAPPIISQTPPILTQTPPISSKTPPPSRTVSLDKKSAPPPKPKRSESTRLTTSFTSTQLSAAVSSSMTSSSDFSQNNKLKLQTSSNNGAVTMTTSTSTNAFHAELQRAMFKRLQQMETNTSNCLNNNNTINNCGVNSTLPANQNFSNNGVIIKPSLTIKNNQSCPPALPPKKLLPPQR